MSECPTCGKVLNTLRGMRQHHTKVHGEALPNRTCKECNEEFYDPRADRAYCDRCYTEEGEANGNWQDAKETARCALCGETFEYYPSDKKGVYCSECVEQAEGLLPEHLDVRIERVEIACQQCEAPHIILPSELRKKTYGTFCDLHCYGEWLSENVVGEDHHQWQGGSIPYGEGWWTVRREARRRDNYTCQNCGVSEHTSERTLDVHHLTPVREFPDPKEAHSLRNVVTLCRPCHRQVEAGSVELGDGEE